MTNSQDGLNGTAAASTAQGREQVRDLMGALKQSLDLPPGRKHAWLAALSGGEVCARCQRRRYGIEQVPPCGAVERDGFWTVECEDGCNGTGRYDQPSQPDYGEECRACKGTGRHLVVLAAMPQVPGPGYLLSTARSES